MRSMNIYEAARFSNRPEVAGSFSFLRLVCSDKAELYEMRAEWLYSRSMWLPVPVR